MASTSSIDREDEVTSAAICSQCQKEATFMCSSCGPLGPRYCSIECQKTDWTNNHHRVCKATLGKKRRTVTRGEGGGGEGSNDIPLNDLSNQEQEQQQRQELQAEEENDLEDLKFYTIQIYRIIKPVVACIILSIFWVKVGFSQSSDYSPIRTNYVSLGSSTSSSSGSSSGSSSSSSSSTSSGIGGSFINAAIIIGQIIAVTVVIVFLFRKGWIKVLIGFFMVVVLMLLGFMTYLLLLNLIQVFFIPLDYITMVFALWNFAVVGLISIFWKGPLWLQQCYLTMMSSLMAFSLTGLEEWTTWILLGLLAIWDLIAVLCPFGPLRLLIESSRTQQKEVPALLYSVNAVWFMMASTDHLQLSSSMLGSSTSVITTNDKVNLLEEEDESFTKKPKNAIQRQSRHSFIMSSTSNRQSRDGFIRLRDDSQQSLQSSTAIGTQHTSSTTAVSSTPPNPTSAENTSTEPDDDDAERSGLKLGLGDFVFYSVLIARAAMYDWITTVCCTIAVLTGLTATIFLLAIYKKALPALPISIAFGILFYFVAKTVLVPYISALCVFGMVGL